MNSESAPPQRRRSPARTRLHVRLQAREREEIDRAVKTGGFRSPGALLLALIRQQEREADQTVTLHAHMQAIVQTAVATAIGSLADRLASDLAALSAAIDARPTKAQMSAFLAHLRTQVTP